MNKQLLRKKMKGFGHKGYDLAKCLGISPQTLSSKMNERSEGGFNVRELMLIKTLYCLTNEEFIEIFFDKEVSKLNTQGGKTK